jgi:hypothetical protein
MSVCGRDHELKSLVVVEADCNVTPAPQLQVRSHAQRHPQCADCIFSLQLPQSELDAIAGEGDMAEVSEEDLAERKRRLATAREVPPVLHVLRLLSLTEMCPQVFGNTRPGSNVWASCITLLDSDTQVRPGLHAAASARVTLRRR